MWMHFRTVSLLAACTALFLAIGAGPASPGSASAQGPTAVAADNPLSGNGMWIWYVSRSQGGNLNRIAATARRNRISTVYIKSSDAGKPWSQFSPGLVQALHSRGLRVCAWQFVYGDVPVAEANLGAQAVAKGADCLLIDAEGHYEGKYASADTYMRALRAQIGPDYPLALAAFPYVHYHPAFPYSVFLGPGMAQYNAPQMYWKAIGTSVKEVFNTTLTYNRPYNRPILPLGQTYQNPKPKQIVKFRRLALTNGGGGVSWWSWQETAGREWKAVRRGVRPGARLPVVYPTLTTGSKGDLVIWAQQHLAGAGLGLDAPVGGVYGPRTAGNVAAFQTTRGLPATGSIDGPTWQALLTVVPVYVEWANAASAGRSALGGSPGAPASASLAPVANEIPPPSKRR